MRTTAGGSASGEVRTCLCIPMTGCGDAARTAGAGGVWRPAQACWSSSVESGWADQVGGSSWPDSSSRMASWAVA